MKNPKLYATGWLCLFAAAFLWGTGTSSAQEYPRAEVYLGYAGIIGFNGSMAYNLNRWFGVAADYSYRVAEFYADKPLQTFAAGPKLAIRQIPRVTPFAHVLFGGAASGCGRYSNTEGCKFGTSPSLLFGAGIDILVNKDVAVRAFQIEKIRTWFGARSETYTGVSFGIVVRIGNGRNR